ncbi:MAG: hypothetical protein JWR19_1283 [Pedosphaera sp.]|nr:hypothetical protein [Pedosphaera sp.]
MGIKLKLRIDDEDEEGVGDTELVFVVGRVFG